MQFEQCSYFIRQDLFMKERLQYARSLLFTTYHEWDKHDAQTHGAALSYFTVLSLAPLLVIAVSIAGLAFRKQAAQIIRDMLSGELALH